jgi:hypothetical protein
VYRRNIKDHAAPNIAVPSVYHSIRVRRESAMEECRKT